MIFADQMLAAFGGISKDIKTPTDWPESIALPGDVRFGFFRGVVVLGAALLIGFGLWWLIRRTRFGKIVRAGVDDRDMVSALGINVQLVFAAAFLLGALLAGLGGVLGGTMISLAPGEDTSFLLNSLIVVIIGGMGSLARRRDRRAGARPGRRLRGRLPRLRRHRPHELLDPRHLRPARGRARGAPAGPVREAGVTPSTGRTTWPVLGRRGSGWPRWRRSCSRDFFVSVILTKSLWLGVAAASLIFLSAYGGMVSLAQVGIYGIAGMTFANLVARRRRAGAPRGRRGSATSPRCSSPPPSGWRSARSPHAASASTS